MVVRSPGHRPKIRDAVNVFPLQIHGVNIRHHPGVIEAPPDDPFSVRGEKWTAVITRGTRQALLVPAIRVHDINLAEKSRIRFEALLVLRREFAQWKGIPQRAENYFSSIRRVGAFGIVTFAFRELPYSA